jgi:2-methylisocitrate lyase-like PEP mutase family enzyme
LTARAECYLVGRPDLRETVRRLQAYAAAGADVLFAPGPQTPAEIETLVGAVAPKPLNLLVVHDIGLGVREIAALGVRRISVGGALALAAWTGFVRAAQELRSKGSFAGLASLVPYADLNRLFAAYPPGQGVHRQLRAEGSIERELPTRGPVDDDWGRSCSLDPENAGDIADEGLGHRG